MPPRYATRRVRSAGRSTLSRAMLTRMIEWTTAFVDPWRDEYWAYVDVRDVADAVVRALRVQGVNHDRFLLSAQDTSVPEETRALVDREFPEVPWPTVDPDRYFADDPYRSLIDCTHALEVLGWQPRHSWRDPALTDAGR